MWVDHVGGSAHEAPHEALALNPLSWLTPHGSRISQPASPLPYPVSILSISWLASAGNARGWAWRFGVLGCGDVQDGLLTGLVPLVPSLLPRGGEHGLLRGRRPALPQDRAPLLRPQLQLEQPHPLGHRLLQPDGRLRAGAPLPAPGAGTALNPPPLPRPLPTAWGAVGRKGGKKKKRERGAAEHTRCLRGSHVLGWGWGQSRGEGARSWWQRSVLCPADGSGAGHQREVPRLPQSLQNRPL